MIQLRFQKEHNMDILSSVLLFAIYIFFLLSLILLSAGIYQKSVESAAYNREVSTTSSYVTTKIHQHDKKDSIFISEIEGTCSLCLVDTIKEQKYITYIYEKDGSLRELFTKEGNPPTLSMGSPISDISDFSVSWESSSLLSFQFQDSLGNVNKQVISLKTSQKGACS